MIVRYHKGSHQTNDGKVVERDGERFVKVILVLWEENMRNTYIVRPAVGNILTSSTEDYT